MADHMDNSEYSELDYCDMDPAKLCDSCCRCIDSGKDFEEFGIELTHRIDDLEEFMSFEEERAMIDELSDHDLWDADMGSSGSIKPIAIDPALKAEWERRLREL